MIAYYKSLRISLSLGLLCSQCPLPGRMTQNFIHEKSEPLMALPFLSCHNFLLFKDFLSKKSTNRYPTKYMDF